MLKLSAILAVLAFAASLSFNATAVENISCSYKLVDGEVKLVKCCDSSQCHEY
ncbi:hypothetical protein [Pseudoalteromonas phenolica]|uniref:hypothetical protein n=1 Tax=Pseudoalteromonas phenolica TaxID=161398 RepID=UPI001485E1B8|nr:hypothetical protein [Pseudoalteromonas phenolica]